MLMGMADRRGDATKMVKRLGPREPCAGMSTESGDPSMNSSASQGMPVGSFPWLRASQNMRMVEGPQ